MFIASEVSPRNIEYLLRESVSWYYYSSLLWHKLIISDISQPILREVTNTNLQFQSTYGDLTKVYGYLKTLFLSIAKIIIKPIFLRDDENASVFRLEDATSLIGNAIQSILDLHLYNYLKKNYFFFCSPCSSKNVWFIFKNLMWSVS